MHDFKYSGVGCLLKSSVSYTDIAIWYYGPLLEKITEKGFLAYPGFWHDRSTRFNTGEHDNESIDM